MKLKIKENKETEINRLKGGNNIFFIFCLIVFIFLLLILSKKLLFLPFSSTSYNNYINVAYGFDKNYHYITHVSMKSIMLSQNKDTYINFYLLISNITKNQRIVIDEICKEYKNCKIKYLDMGNAFNEFNISNVIWSKANFYRIKLPDLLLDEKKIIYLDTDTLVYKDLSKLYNHNINGKYFIGMLENKDDKFFKKYNSYFNNFINTGVLLCNLEELRKGNISKKIEEFLLVHKYELEFPVNEPTNYITHKKNGYFSPEYAVIGFCNEDDAFSYYNYSKIKINKNKVLESYKDPYIYHFIYYTKPWRGITNKHGNVCFDPIMRFYEMAKKTKYYYKILKEFPVNIK